MPLLKDQAIDELENRLGLEETDVGLPNKGADCQQVHHRKRRGGSLLPIHPMAMLTKCKAADVFVYRGVRVCVCVRERERSCVATTASFSQHVRQEDKPHAT